MDKLDVVGLVAAIFSIISAIVSFVILLKNKTIRQEIINKKEISDYTEFVTKSKLVIENIRKFTTTKIKTQGLSMEKLVEYLKDYYELIKDVEYKLSNNDKILIKECIMELEKDIQFFSCHDNKIFMENRDELSKTYFNIIKIQNLVKEITNGKIY
jgi:hypothetical protein